jgi:hypothetical protein
MHSAPLNHERRAIVQGNSFFECLLFEIVHGLRAIKCHVLEIEQNTF